MAGLNNPSSLTEKALSSLWGGLSPHLIASFWAVERDGSSRNWIRAAGSPTVQAALTESNLEMVFGWQSPFENAGTESVAPTLSAMLQSGAIQPFLGNQNEGLAASIGAIEGRSGVTKLNSTQVFNGVPPVKIQVTALFRAWRDTSLEVEAPVNQLVQWALPKKLASDGMLMRALDAVKDVAAGKPIDEAAANTLFPSLAPTKIAMRYKGRLYSPMVIESIGLPISSPVDSEGRYVELAVPMTLATLTAIDREDWARSARGSGFES